MTTITGTSGDDTLTGSGSAETLRGLSGDDTIDGGGGHDFIDGGNGDDVVVAYAGDTIKAGDGVDQLLIYGQVPGTIIDLSAMSSPDVTATINVAGALKVSGFEVTGIYGSGLSDRIIGSGVADYIFAGNGADVVDAGAGDDYVKSSLGDDTLNGGAGIDRIGFFNDAPNGAHVDLRLQGTVQDTGAGKDLLSGFENVSGTAVSDTLIGNGDDNILWGSGFGGNDVLSGNAGNDHLEVGDGGHTINGGDGIDTLSLYGNSTETSAGVHIDLTLQGATPQDTGVGMMQIKNIENLTGSIHDDKLTGDRFDNVLGGSEGGDSLSGGLGNDRLLGDGLEYSNYAYGLSGPAATLDADYDAVPGADVLDGGKGSDTLVGGAGSDTSTGGASADTFVFLRLLDSAVDARDLITDFNANGDFLDVSAIDADATADGDQAFHLVAAFTGAAGEAQVTYDRAAAITTVALDVDGDGNADAAINLTGRFTIASLNDGTFVA